LFEDKRCLLVKFSRGLAFYRCQFELDRWARDERLRQEGGTVLIAFKRGEREGGGAHDKNTSES
jgi:hypothetical protein